MEFKRLGDCDYKFMQIVWEQEPVNSGKLVELCKEELGWKKSTTYTTIKKLAEKGLLQNERAVVSSMVSQEQVQREESDYFVNRTFGGSLPQFIAAFLGGKTISEQEAEEIQRMIEEHKATEKKLS